MVGIHDKPDKTPPHDIKVWSACSSAFLNFVRDVSSETNGLVSESLHTLRLFFTPNAGESLLPSRDTTLSRLPSSAMPSGLYQTSARPNISCRKEKAAVHYVVCCHLQVIRIHQTEGKMHGRHRADHRQTAFAFAREDGGFTTPF